MTKHHRMPKCTNNDILKVLEPVASMRGASRDAALDLVNEIDPKGLCILLHSMRRWYSYQMWNSAKKILALRGALDQVVMDLDPESAVGAYRGFKVDATDVLADVEVGDTLSLPVNRNGGCSSWTVKRSIANRFSGASKGKVGLVIRLASSRCVTPFIAPPSRTEDWFDRLYKNTMGSAYRFKEHEYAIHANVVDVEIVRVKR
jgi:hypothetical protein